ncbi:MAG: hypothetical protein KF857_05830 [Fimbriimonadaceae bacterium]|nr:hypothetical protein [Fimbriimonadaceae bacterium]
MTTAIHRFVEACENGTHPSLVARVPSGWVVMGEQQVLPGYCLLYPERVVPDLNALTGDERARFLADMARVGDALLACTDAVRINYEILGNLEPALHAHIVPRYADEPAELRTRPFWFYDWPSARRFDPETDDALRQALRRRLSGEGLSPED